MQFGITSFSDNGFAAFEQFIDSEGLAQLRKSYDYLLTHGAKDPRSDDRLLGGLTRQIMGPEFSLPFFADNAALEAGFEIAREMCGWDRPIKTFSMLIYKPPGHPHETPWHQDASYAVEPVTPAGIKIGKRTLQFWVAVDDADIKNGCMHFHPNTSDKTLAHYVSSGSTTEQSRLLAIENLAEHVTEAGITPVPLKAGGATVHHEGTPHFTPPNHSDRPRRAYIFNITNDRSPTQTRRESR